MNIDASKTYGIVDKQNLQLVQEKLAQTLETLDYYGVSGAITVCLLPDGASYFTSSGMCVDTHGATMGLYAGLTAIRDLAKEKGDEALLATITDAVQALTPLLQDKVISEMH